ncbi:transposase [Paraburkholderia kururiensis]
MHRERNALTRIRSPDELETYAGYERSQAAEADINGTPGPDDLIEQGARRIIQQAIEAELAAMLEQYSNVKTIDGRRAVVRNGYLPEREIVTAVGPVPVQVPKVRYRSGSGIKFNSTIVPPYVRKSPRVSSSLPWLYLRGVSTGGMGDALSELLGEQAKGLSASVVSRLKAAWSEEYEKWNKRDLSASRWVYWWADGIHTQARAEDSDGQCLLVIIGVKPDGSKERVALNDGYREWKESWKELLLDLKKRGRQAPPLLAVGDGAMGLWAALEEVFPQTRHQRCWFSQDRQHTQRHAQIAARQGQGCARRDMECRDKSRRNRRVQPVRRHVRSQVPKGRREAHERPRRTARVLRLPGRTLAARADHESD